MIKKIIVLGLLFCSSSIFAEQERTLDPKTFVQRTLNAEKIQILFQLKDFIP